MRILRTILLALLLIIALAAVGGFVLFNDLTRGPLPSIDGEIRVSGLQDTVTVKRDDWGVPHIYASNIHDLLFAQGYTQAQDRWWQMEFFRATGDGRLQELTGRNDDLMGNDVFIRTIGWRRAAERDLAEVMTDEDKALLQAFADGVNAYINGKAGGDLALDYSLLGVNGVTIPVRPWTLGDTVVWQKIMAWDLSDGMYDIDRAQLIDSLGEELYTGLNPEYAFDRNPTIVEPDVAIPTEASLASNPVIESVEGYASADITFAGNLTTGARFAFGEGEGLGSNNWVVSGDQTESGLPLLANDPHLGIQMPSIWYEVGLHCRPHADECPMDVQGFTFGPFPGVVIGHNDRVAWGFTNVGPDVMDLYTITVNPDNPLQYEWDGEWRDMTVHDEVIGFGDSDETITIQVRETHLGPIINDNQLGDDGLPSGFNTENPLALRWTALDPGRTVSAIFGLNTAQNWEEFRAAAASFDAPSQNLVYADTDGNIAYQTPGLIPIRPASVSGLVPIDGSTSDNEWLGYVPYDLLPRVLNPESGYIHSANEALVPLDYYEWLKEQLASEYGEDINVVISTDWDDGYRGRRIVDRLTSEAPFNVGKFEAVQADVVFLPALEVLPHLEALEFEDAAVSDARDWLLTWNGSMDMNSPQAALFGQFWSQLTQAIYLDQSPDAAGGQWPTVRLLELPDDAWWDDTATADVTETRDDILTRAFTDAYNANVEALGADRDAWQWGKLHTVTFVSNPLGQSGISLIEDIFNRGPLPTSGSRGTVSATNWDYASGDFTVQSGSSFRMIVDLSDLDNSVNMHTTGQSGHPYSPYYANMIDSWRNVTYKPMTFSDDAVSGTTTHTLTLRP
jgi:penicillin amidase